MIAGSLARRYARALFEVGLSHKSYEALAKELDDLAATYESSRELAEALTNPVFPRQKRQAVLEAVLKRAGVSPVTRNFCLLLLDRERIPYLVSIARELRAMVDEKAGNVRAQVTSARPLSAVEVDHLKKTLEEMSGKHVVLETRTDPELLGGVVAKVGDIVYDGSIRTKLEQMRERFLQE